MKIYASDNLDTTATPFDEYVGKNVWVACGTGNTDIFFIRFLKKECSDGGIPRVGFITDSLNYSSVTRFCEKMHPELSGQDMQEYLALTSQLQVATPMYYSAAQLSLVAPITIKTSEELFNRKRSYSDNPIVDKIIGKPYWVRANVHHIADYYVSFLEKHGDVVECERINSGYLYDYCWSEDDPYPEDWFINETIHLDNIEIYDPLDILTDEEIQELYEVSRGLWEEEEDE